MKDNFVEIKPGEMTDNPFKLIGSDWMLITAGNMQSYNTMTASWGGFGVLWNKNIAICVVRPSRHTFGFMESAETFTLSFFDEHYRKILNYCGTHSGRDCNKATETGLTAVQSDTGSVYFEQARLVLECRKLYFQDINPSNFLDTHIDKHYSSNDYHRMYAGEIIQCLRK